MGLDGGILACLEVERVGFGVDDGLGHVGDFTEL